MRQHDAADDVVGEGLGEGDHLREGGQGFSFHGADQGDQEAEVVRMLPWGASGSRCISM